MSENLAVGQGCHYFHRSHLGGAQRSDGNGGLWSGVLGEHLRLLGSQDDCVCSHHLVRLCQALKCHVTVPKALVSGLGCEPAR